MVAYAWVQNFEGLYMVSSLGNIYSWASGERIQIQPSYNKNNGHYSIILGQGGRRFYMSRLIYSTFKGIKLTSKDWIRHKDGDLSNNSLANLELKSCKTKNIEAPPGPENATYMAIDESGKHYYFNTLYEIESAFGVSYKKIRHSLETGDELEIIPKKNL
jgi:hypothetical protein